MRRSTLRWVAVAAFVCATWQKWSPETIETSDLSSFRSIKQHPGVTPHECAVNVYIEEWERKFGGHVFEFFAMVYVFLGMAVLIDTHFIYALENITHSIQLPEHVVGATFMAVANSSPEYFISIVSTISTGRGDMGLATIIGACLFNICICVAVSILSCRGQKLEVLVGPTIRDIIAYAVALGAVLLIFMKGYASLAVSIIFLLSYPIYMCVLLVCYTGGKEPRKEDPEVGEADSLIQRAHPEAVVESAPTEPEDPGIVVRILSALTYPWVLCFNLFFRESIKSFFYTQFFMSLVFIMLLAFVIVKMVHRLECGFEISGDLIGLTILAIGVTTPDVLSNSIVAKQGYGDMALSSSLSSNVSAISFGLGGSWLYLNLLHGTSVKLQSKGIKTAVVLLCGTFLLFVLSMVVTKFVLYRAHAYVYLVYYFVVLAIILSGVLDQKIPVAY
eukprot:c26173_g1_i1.p1 GENE.c26173_g1_i1~~c26173_g1_i1.p1  ORF type:complete len:454 (+),score=62.39 c26173_g1_i1:26-1363(+)